jgi:chitin synthase
MYFSHDVSEPCNQDPAIARALDVSRRFDNVICMTLYNEDLTMFGGGLAALVKSTDKYERSHAGSMSNASGTCIAIIADGIERVDEEVLSFLRKAGLIDTGFDFPALGETVHYSQHVGSQILAALGADGKATATIHFAVCVKAKNHGKLHSHAVFFQGICEELKPRFCFQIDAGTIVDDDAVGRLVAFMEENPSVAAGASRILTPAPEAADSPLAIWQFMDFVSQKAVVWPTEVASGYLSVIPGQFCVFRWSAIDSSAMEENGTRPIDSYLRGLNGGSPLERVMFLAEDRVFGNEIVLAKDTSWKIGYCPEARATTDSCDTFGELLRQRRRWHNSALAVRLWLWSRWPAYLSRGDKRLMEKFRFSTAMSWQGLLTMFEVLSPAFLFLFLWTAFDEVGSTTHKVVVGTIFAVLIATTLLTVITARAAPTHARPMLCQARNIGAAVFIAMLAGWTVYSSSLVNAATLLAPAVILAAVIAALFPGNRWTILKHLPLYLLLDRVITPVLHGYALANMHNVSWGTKGLVKSADATRAEKIRMRRFRDLVAGTVLLINCGLVVAGLYYHSAMVGSTNMAVELFTVIWLTIVAAAALTHLAHAYRVLNPSLRLPAERRLEVVSP